VAKYKLSNVAKEDLIRIHQNGIERFGMDQADKFSINYLSILRSLLKDP
jgi:toxin ParE1/3/4